MHAHITREGSYWVLVINRADGTVNDYRFQSKSELKKFAAAVGIIF